MAPPSVVACRRSNDVRDEATSARSSGEVVLRPSRRSEAVLNSRITEINLTYWGFAKNKALDI
jgi:hypothetical protein